jgi:SAM-dependent methyltransferase
MFSPPDYSAPENFLNPRFGPWTVFLYLHRKPILDAVREAAPQLRGRLLDVGCGKKPYASLLNCTEHVGVDVENSPHPRDAMDKIYDGQTLPFADEEFDSLLCTEVLEHCRDPQRVMREMYRVLKPGGYALITVPMIFHHHEEPWDFQRFTHYGMEWLAKQANLRVLWIKPRGAVYSTTLAMLYTALSYSLSRRPFIDIALWGMWPFTVAMLTFDSFKKNPVTMSLGWQMFVQRDANPPRS